LGKAAVLVLGFAFLLFAKPSTPELPEIALDFLLPTQFNAGFREVYHKINTVIVKKIKNGDWKDYKKAHPVSVVIGPKGEYYLVDGHHFALALIFMGKKSVYYEVKETFTGVSYEEFWKQMEKKGYIWLKDQGRLREVSDLPKKLTDLTDDAYRSFAWFVREEKAYEDLKTPFQEFYWADFFRERISLHSGLSIIEWDTKVQEGVKLALSPEANHLLGWRGKCSNLLAKK